MTFSNVPKCFQFHTKHIHIIKFKLFNESEIHYGHKLMTSLSNLLYRLKHSFDFSSTSRIFLFIVSFNFAQFLKLKIRIFSLRRQTKKNNRFWNWIFFINKKNIRKT